MPKNLWNDADAAALPDLDGLVYRSRLLGADRAVCNIYGGNTSAKMLYTDHVGRQIRVLWVKGSGSDIADITERGFAGLRMDEIDPLIKREAMPDEEMVAYLERCAVEPGRPRQSIETLLHAFVPHPHVDHTHPDALISLACTPSGEATPRKIYGSRMAWVPYIQPGFTLSKWIGQQVIDNPKIECVVMGKHGLVAWGLDSKTCYNNSIRLIQEAEDYIAEHQRGKSVFGALKVPHMNWSEQREILTQVLPQIRGAASAERPTVLLVDTSDPVVDYASRERTASVSQQGAACPDHLVHVKRQPLYIDWTPDAGVEALRTKIREGVTAYRERYRTEYFEKNKRDFDVIGDASPRVILIPGLGMVTTGKDAQAADVSQQLYHRAISVIGGSEALESFESLTAAEAFGIEYWPLELYKLRLRPPDRELAGQIAFVTGAASGIGRATALRLAAEGAHVVIADINADGAQTVAQEIVKKHGLRRAMSVRCDVTSEEAIAEAFKQTVLAYGGVDIVVNNAGISTSAPIEEVTLADWNRNMSILATGYFLVAREAFRVWKNQGMGGKLIFVCSKNSVAAGKNAAAYSAAKAAELHLARCLAEEGGAHGIRVNSVMPDAVLQGSSIWDSQWRTERAKNYGIAPDQLDEFYRNRTTLKVSIYPDDIAESILFFASKRSAKTTGGALTVDGGVPLTYMR